MSEPKHCPLCGQTDKLNVDTLGDPYDWFVECERCHMGTHAIFRGREATLAAWNKRPVEDGLARLLIECRDALPAISTVAARLHGISLSLADRIEEALKPWECAPGEDGI